MKIIRLATERDYSEMLEIYRPYVENTRISFEYETPSAEQFAARLNAIAEKHPVIVCEENGQVLGYAYTCDAFERKAYAWSAELSVYVDGAFRGRGTGKALVHCAEDIVRFLGYRMLYSLVTEENGESIAFHRALGYNEVARFPEQGFKTGKWVGVVWLCIELNGREVSKAFPPAICRVEREKIAEILKKYNG